jgi:mRNA interferase MazF
VLVIQGDAFNRSRIATVVVVPMTSDIRLASMPGNVLLPSRKTGLPKDSVANVSQVVSIDRALLTERIGRISGQQLDQIWTGIDLVLDRSG